jgi:hypothetical protein
MRLINVDGLKFLGRGEFGNVYKLSPTKVIKVYMYYRKHDVNIMAEEIELSTRSEHALPVADVAIARKRNKCYYAVIKKYLSNEATYGEIASLKKLLPKELKIDCHSDNVRKDEKGRVFLIDTQGTYAFRVMQEK